MIDAAGFPTSPPLSCVGMGDGTLSALRRRAHTLRTRASEPSGIRLADKLLFCAGVTFIPVTEWVMIVHPYRFSYWYCPHARVPKA